MENFKHRFVRLNAALLEQWFRHIADKLHELIPGPPTIAFILFHDERNTVMASIIVPDDSAPLVGSVAFMDAHGHPTTADDVPAWTSSDESVAVLTVADDGLSASVEILAPGVTLIDVLTTNDDGSTAAAQGTITVQPGDAVIGEVTFA